MPEHLLEVRVETTRLTWSVLPAGQVTVLRPRSAGLHQTAEGGSAGEDGRRSEDRGGKCTRRELSPATCLHLLLTSSSH